MIIYLDESGNIGLNFEHQKTSRYLIIGLLVFPDGVASAAHINMVQAVKRTLKNKLPKYAAELKGNKLILPIKQYFLRIASKQSNWCLYMAISDKKSWVTHHRKNNLTLEKKVLYDEVAKRIFSQIDDIEKVSNIDLIVDCSKSKRDIIVFDKIITGVLSNRLAKKACLSIKHRSSQEEIGLQAIDIFCSGVSEKYERNNLTWYAEFSDRIAVEVEYKF